MNHFLTLALAAVLLSPSYLQAQALNFDGTDDYVTIDAVAPEFTGLTSFTVEFWVKGDKNLQSSIRVGLFAVNAGVSQGDNVFIITMGGLNNPNAGKLLIVDNVTGFDFVSTQVIGDNLCHHIAYVRNQSAAYIYIDGVQAGTHVPNYTFSATNRYSLGQEWDYAVASDLFEGTMEEVRLWNTARTASEIANNMGNELSGTETGLIAYYPFNQGNANANNAGLTTLTDFSPNGNSGTLSNFALTGSVSNWVDACNGQITPNGIAEQQIVRFRVYPNPAADLVRVQGVFDAPKPVVIVNAQGETVLRTVLTGTDPLIDIRNLSSGMYFVCGEEIRTRFIKH